MNALMDPAAVECFRAIVARRLGLHFDDSKLAFLAEVLRRRLDATDLGCETYLQRLEAPEDRGRELRVLAQELTVTETYFFRNLEQFRAFAEVALPERIRARSAQRTLRLLSAGCASGEEAYSLAMLVGEQLSVPAGWEVSIRAVDINAAMLEKASRARYSGWSLRETPPESRKRYFRELGCDFLLYERVRAMVSFEERNLVEDDPALWQPGSYDIIFCRNVVMYFTPDSIKVVVSRMTQALAPGGFLFLGHAETLRGISQDFHLCHTHGTFYYQRKELEDRASLRTSPGARSESSLPVGAALAAVADTADSWVETIHRATDRIQVLTGPPSGEAARPLQEAPGRSRAVRAPWDLGLAVELLRKERFAEALAHVRTLPPESAGDPDVLLMGAVLLTQSGQLVEAERVCTDLLALDEMNAGAHYLMALCREGAGDRQGALDHDQAAIYLDPAFAMPRLHLGLLARRAGERQAARRELGQALVLLQREEASRVLLFGGGFSRDALVALCRAELEASGGTP